MIMPGEDSTKALRAVFVTDPKGSTTHSASVATSRRNWDHQLPEVYEVGDSRWRA